ncbi:MAG TPA: hypothetical protein VGM59_06860 [Dongiaceae bacterium]
MVDDHIDTFYFRAGMRNAIEVVMAGLGPAIHAFSSATGKGVDARTKCGHDGE